MATVRLERDEVDNDSLPDVCMVCGAEATLRKRKSFSWHPPWVILLILISLWPYIIVALILTKRMTVRAPLCEQHKNHWAWRTAFILGGFLVFLLLGVVSVMVLSNQANQGGADEAIGGLLCFGTVISGLVWLIAAAIIHSLGIRPTEITDRTITLVHVSPAFVEALEMVRAEQEDKRQRLWQDRRPMDRAGSEGIQDRKPIGGEDPEGIRESGPRY